MDAAVSRRENSSAPADPAQAPRAEADGVAADADALPRAPAVGRSQDRAGGAAAVPARRPCDRIAEPSVEEIELPQPCRPRRPVDAVARPQQQPRCRGPAVVSVDKVELEDLTRASVGSRPGQSTVARAEDRSLASDGAVRRVSEVDGVQRREVKCRTCRHRNEQHARRHRREERALGSVGPTHGRQSRPQSGRRQAPSPARSHSRPWRRRRRPRLPRTGLRSERRPDPARGRRRRWRCRRSCA